MTLAGLGLLVLRPASELLRRQVDELRRARDELEAKVRERTRALEEEAERRSLAEARHRSVLEIAGRASRVSTLGEMAGSLAHELNQPLGAVANYTEGCLFELGRESPDLDEVRGALQKALASTLRARRGSLRRVRQFVTRRGMEREAVEPDRLLKETAELLADEARRRSISVWIDAVSDLPLLWADPVQVQQVLINLVRNAFEAIDASQKSSRTVLLAARRADSGRASH